MDLFTDVRGLYGQSTVKKIRDLENINKKISRHKNHLTFTHVTPISLKLKCPIRTNKAQSIIKKAEKELLRDRIRIISNKIGNLETKHQVINSDLETLVNPEVKSRVDFHVNKSRQAEFSKCKTRQIRKLERLTEKYKSQSAPLKGMRVDLSGNQLKKWVRGDFKTQPPVDRRFRPVPGGCHCLEQ